MYSPSEELPKFNWRGFGIALLMLVFSIGVYVWSTGGWGKLFRDLTSKSTSHAGHIGYGKAPFPELPDPDKPHVVQWQSGQCDTGYFSIKASLPYPQGTSIEMGLRDDGMVVWRKK